MTSQEPIFIGFFPKKICRDTAFLNLPGVKQICSVSDCISESPEDYVTKWLHNDLHFFDTEVLAIEVLQKGQESAFELFAYDIFPLQFDENGLQEWISEVQLTRPDLSTYKIIGYDLVSKTPNQLDVYPAQRYAWECSPLSCNHRAVDYPVNEYCLLNDYDVALKAGLDFGNGGGEPGPYHLLRVWKKI
jgi:hypothetical protein